MAEQSWGGGEHVAPAPMPAACECGAASSFKIACLLGAFHWIVAQVSLVKLSAIVSPAPTCTGEETPKLPSLWIIGRRLWG
jgi:hypothetical protein